MKDTGKQVEYRGTGFYVSLVFAGIVVLALLALAIQNTDSVTFEFLWWAVEIPLFGIILIVALLAVIIDELVGLVWRRTRRTRLSEKHELEMLRRERPVAPGTPSSVTPVGADETDDGVGIEPNGPR